MIWEVKFPPQSSISAKWYRNELTSQAPESSLKGCWCPHLIPPAALATGLQLCPHHFWGLLVSDSSQRSDETPSLVHSFKGMMVGTLDQLLAHSTGRHRVWVVSPSLWVWELLAAPQVPSVTQSIPEAAPEQFGCLWGGAATVQAAEQQGPGIPVPGLGSSSSSKFGFTRQPLRTGFMEPALHTNVARPKVCWRIYAWIHPVLQQWSISSLLMRWVHRCVA